MFEYYKAKPTKEESPKGQINLEDCKAVNSGLNHNKHKFVFSIELKDRTYFLVAGSTDEMTAWVTTLCSYCGFSNPGTGENCRHWMSIVLCVVVMCWKYCMLRTPL